MVTELKVTPPGRGGNHHPLSVRAFILGHLANNGEAYIANMHRAYRDELKRLAEIRGLFIGKRSKRIKPYHCPRYHSFAVKVQSLIREGLIEFSGREEESDAPPFRNPKFKPMRRYYRLRGASL